mmetsp:Transcript_37659/g.111761  ORF Transcript_37659/g.111761 Transcript_37659/m.111761 type:complete len:230 (+) Transcript_37659:2169-2858(+)
MSTASRCRRTCPRWVKTTARAALIRSSRNSAPKCSSWSTSVPSWKRGCSTECSEPSGASPSTASASAASAAGSAGASAPAGGGALRISSRSCASSRRSITSQPEGAAAGHSGRSGMAAAKASAFARASSAAACSASFCLGLALAAASSAATASASAAALASFCSSDGSTFTVRPRSLQKPSVIPSKNVATLPGYLVWMPRRVSAWSRYCPSQVWRWSKACCFRLSRSSW